MAIKNEQGKRMETRAQWVTVFRPVSMAAPAAAADAASAWPDCSLTATRTRSLDVEGRPDDVQGRMVVASTGTADATQEFAARGGAGWCVLMRPARRLLPLLLLSILAAGCGAPYTLTVRNDYPFPVEVIQRQAGKRLSRQDEPLGTVPPGAEKTFTGSHPYVSATATLAIMDQQGRPLREISETRPSGFSRDTDGRRTTATFRVGPPAAPPLAPRNAPGEAHVTR